jgi:alpha-2-macroglobulin-like protein
LALDYMKRTKKLSPETHAKAEGYIANGYQRLLTFEVPGGGFSWFGQAPANKILTAYGLMEFNDMAQVSEVDPRVIARTRDWLVNQQQADGNWAPDTRFINEGATDRYNSNVLRITAYIAWSLVNTGMQGPAIDRARKYIDEHLNAAVDPYTLAVIANFAADDHHDREFTRRAMQLLLDARSEQADQVSWKAEETPVYATGSSAAIETTGLATEALLKWGQASETVRKALNFITAKKEASGAWGTTQATIMALRALIQATQLSAGGVRGRVEIMIDGKQVKELNLTAENDDLLHQFVFKGVDAHQTASVQLHFEGTGSLAYQVVGRSFVPWDEQRTSEPLSINLAYDRTRLQENDLATETVTIRNNLPKTANMIMVDLGIPPGFDLLSEDLQAFQEKTAGARAGRLEKFTQTATQAILYFNSLAPYQKVELKIRLRAKYPMRAQTFQSRLYEYYDPGVSTTAKPVRLEVMKR